MFKKLLYIVHLACFYDLICIWKTERNQEKIESMSKEELVDFYVEKEFEIAWYKEQLALMNKLRYSTKSVKKRVPPDFGYSFANVSDFLQNRCKLSKKRV